MRAIFVDPSAWDALEDSSDRHHAAAVRYRATLRQERMPLYVTNFVLDECYTLLLQNVGYARTVAFKRTVDRMQTGGGEPIAVNIYRQPFAYLPVTVIIDAITDLWGSGENVRVVVIAVVGWGKPIPVLVSDLNFLHPQTVLREEWSRSNGKAFHAALGWVRTYALKGRQQAC